MKGLNGWREVTIHLVAVPVLILAAFLPVIGGGVPAQAAINVTAEEARMLELVNQARNAAGLPSLYVEQRLTDFARSYSQEMIQYNFFGHESPVSGGLQQRIAARGITGWTLAGENIAKAPNVDVAFQALMNSPSHRENILRREFNCIGVGVVPGPGGLYITQEFMCFNPLPATAEPVGAVGTSPAPAATFDTFVLIMNPNGATARVEVTFQGEDGDNRAFTYQVGAYSRFTVPARETVGRGSFSVRVKSDLPVLAERAMYFDYMGKKGGSDSIGAPAPSNSWFFAEGYTGGTFDTWILLQNPNESGTAVTLSFMRPDGRVVTRQVNVPARRRYTVHVDEIPGLESTDVSTQVTSDLPIVAERAMYFSYAGRDGGHVSIGAPAPSNSWFFAEGYTGGTFDTWILLQNPNESGTAVTLSFMRPDGRVVTRQVNVPARRRYTVHVDEIPGLESTDVSTQVTSDLPIVAERAMYFSYTGRLGGHNTIGAQVPRGEWYLAEGYTGGSFDLYVLLVNPHEQESTVNLCFMRPDGNRVERAVRLAPRSRYTVHVDDIPGLSSTDVSTQVRASVPVVAELAEYFNFGGITDGNSSVGAMEPSTDWYFAEGCVL
ncbi:MAG: CAP domain-containing protein [Actinomycetota bacterium]